MIGVEVGLEAEVVDEAEVVPGRRRVRTQGECRES